MDIDILFSDNHLVVALKKAGVLTQKDTSNEESLEDLVKAWMVQEYKKSGNIFLHCIHRLDKPVSGLVLFAKTSKALSRLNEQSRAMEIQRSYIAEVEGLLMEKSGRLDHHLIHGDHRAHVVKSGTEGSKHARLTYEVVKLLPHSTIVKIALETGRYHQIRIQFSAIGHPIVGDKKYGSKTVDGNAIALHCEQVSFVHPVTKEILSFESPAPFSISQ